MKTYTYYPERLSPGEWTRHENNCCGLLWSHGGNFNFCICHDKTDDGDIPKEQMLANARAICQLKPMADALWKRLLDFSSDGFVPETQTIVRLYDNVREPANSILQILIDAGVVIEATESEASHD